MASFLPPIFTCCTACSAPRALQDAQDAVVEMREHDVPYHVRFAIDTDTRCGHWFTVRAKVGGRGTLWRGQGDVRLPMACASVMVRGESRAGG
jgi:DNA polymerase elongation subunit (family B)